MRKAVTLVELLVVISIVGLLTAIALPAVMVARETARKMSCSNNLKQTTLALHHYELARGAYPPSWLPTAPDAGGKVNGWSVHAQLLPYLEQDNVYKQIDFRLSYKLAPKVPHGAYEIPLAGMRIPTYLCPSDIGDSARMDDEFIPKHYPVSYGANLGVWFVWQPNQGLFGDGAFRPKRGFLQKHMTDGLSTTIAFAEVKARTPYFRNAGHVSPTRPSPDEVAGLGGQFKTSTGHTEWVDGRVHQIGFTALFGPNTVVPYQKNGTTYDVDWTNQQEGTSRSIPTFAAVTSRSYHRGGVQVAMLDGSVHFVAENVDLAVWQALATRRHGDVVNLQGF